MLIYIGYWTLNIYYYDYYVNKLAEKAETAAQKGELSTVYRITKQLSRHTKVVVAGMVKDKNGNARTTEQMQAKRWAEHYTKVLNTEAPTITADPTAPNDNLDIAAGVQTLQDVTHVRYKADADRKVSRNRQHLH